MPEIRRVCKKITSNPLPGLRREPRCTNFLSMDMNFLEKSGGTSDPLDHCPTFPAQHIASYKYDLHLVYLALMKHLQDRNIPWDELPWASRLTSFENFLASSWRVMNVTDRNTGKPHIAVTHRSIRAFKNMIIEKYPETYSVFPDFRNSVQLVDPFEKLPPSGLIISNYASYNGLLSTFPTAIISDLSPDTAFFDFRWRVRQGDLNEIRKVWNMKDRTFLCMEFQKRKVDDLVCSEWGYVALCCSQLNNRDHWPPNPNTDYRTGHFIVAESIGSVTSEFNVAYPWDYAFGKSKIIPMADLPGLIRDTISVFASPKSESVPNTLVVVAHNFAVKREWLKTMGIKFPYNVLRIDTGSLEQSLYNSGCRGKMVQFKSIKESRADPESKSIYVEPIKEREPLSMLSLKNLLLTLETHPAHPIPQKADSQLFELGNNSGGELDEGVVSPIGISTIVPNVTLQNSGNRSFMCLYAFQKMLDAQGTEVPKIVAETETGHETSWTSKL